MTSSTTTVRFYFDYLSHNAYLAWTQIHGVCQRHDAALEPVPVLFAGLLNAHGQLGPAEVPAKSRWMLRDCLRKAKQLGVPLNPPASHPFNPLTALRASCVHMPPADFVRLISALFDGVWVHGKGIGRADEVQAVLNSAGLDGATLVARAATQPMKQALRDNTDAAVAVGVFGVPAMQVGDALFWGYDDLVHLDAYLGGREIVTDAELEPWLNIPATANRNRDSK